MNKLKTLVRALCLKNDIKLKELAKRMEIEPVSLSQMLSRDNPHRGTLRKFAKAFNIEEKEFIGLYLYGDAMMVGTTSPRLSAPNEKSSLKLNVAPQLSDSSPKTYKDDEVSLKKISAVIDYDGHSLKATSMKALRNITNIIDALISLKGTMPPNTYNDLKMSLFEKYGV